MAEDGILHTTELLRSALPHVDTRTKLTLDLLVKLYELMICVRNYRTNDIAACSFEDEKMDMETLLNSIQPKCNEKERPFVDKMLSIFQAKRMFEMYNTYMEAMKTMQGFEGFGSGTSDSNDSDSGGSGFSGFDFSSIFGEDFSAASFSDNNNDLDSDNIDEDKDSNTDDDNLYPLYPDDNISEEIKDPNGSPDNDTVSETDNNNISDNDNSSVFESLKAMIPPEQMGTFENLRMLFGSMSYDDNNKPDDHKE